MSAERSTKASWELLAEVSRFNIAPISQKFTSQNITEHKKRLELTDSDTGLTWLLVILPLMLTLITINFL